jgi:hypothetical protein
LVAYQQYGPPLLGKLFTNTNSTLLLSKEEKTETLKKQRTTKDKSK